MKRFASHYTYIPSYGFLKQYVIGIVEGIVVTLYPLKEEVESIIWTPGVIRLVPRNLLESGKSQEEYVNQIMTFNQTEIKETYPVKYDDIAKFEFAAVRLYPFNFTDMKTTPDTVFQILSKVC